MTRDERIVVLGIRAQTRLTEARELIHKAHTDLAALLSHSGEFDALFVEVDKIHTALDNLSPSNKWQEWAKGG